MQNENELFVMYGIYEHEHYKIQNPKSYTHTYRIGSDRITCWYTLMYTVHCKHSWTPNEGLTNGAFSQQTVHTNI